MINATDITDILANGFFGGDVVLCGLIIYAIVISAVFILTKRMIVGFVVMLPMTLVFAYLGLMPDTLMIILIVASVLGIAIAGRNTAGDGL